MVHAIEKSRETQLQAWFDPGTQCCQDPLSIVSTSASVFLHVGFFL